ncbi:hypothetical protein ACQP2F_33315 [Actinoplanes sp. CA-030573]|uniref:hypothetical protein n=1 Tax=Actinoplanes sp. CA-030573 TaxID=3239898 RepID=UPI003D8F12A6
MILFTHDGGIFATEARPSIASALLRLLSASRDGELRRAVELVEDARKHVLRALEVTVCHLPLNDTLAHDEVTAWTHVIDIADLDGLNLLNKLSGPQCIHTAFGAAAVTAWRTLANRAVAYRDGHVPWRAVTDQAENTIKICRWIYDGGYAHTFGQY